MKHCDAIVSQVRLLSKVKSFTPAKFLYIYIYYIYIIYKYICIYIYIYIYIFYISSIITQYKWNVCLSKKNLYFSESMASSMVHYAPPHSFREISHPLHSEISPQHHCKEKLSHQIQSWLLINCGKAFVWEITYPLESLDCSGGW